MADATAPNVITEKIPAENTSVAGVTITGQTISGAKVEEKAIEPPKVETPNKDFEQRAQAEKQRRAWQKRQHDIKNYEKQLLQRAEQLEKREQELQIAQTNPLEALKRLGWTHDQLNEFALQNKVPVDKNVQDIRREVEDLKRQSQQEKIEAAEYAAKAAKQEAEETIQEFKQSVNEFIASKPDDYELLNTYGEQELVHAIIEQHWAKTHKVMEREEACKIAENYLEELIEKGTKTKKLSAKLQAKVQTPDKPGVKREESKTLTNNLNTSTPSLLPAKTEQDRLQRAMAALSGGN